MSTWVTPKVTPGTTLQDQRDVARQIEDLMAGRPILFLRNAEMPFLLRYENPSPYIHWNAATLSHVTSDTKGKLQQAVRQLVETADVDAYVVRKRLSSPPWEGYTQETIVSRTGRYRVFVFLRDSR